MVNLINRFLLPTVIIFFAICGCVRNNVAAPREIEKHHSGSLSMPLKKDIPRVIYVDMRDSAGPRSSLPPEIIDAIRHENFEITDSPSKAGYILHINIIREDTVDPLVFAEIAKAGYGGEANFSGSGAKALLADAILVQRNVPAAKRPSQERLKNISARNARDSGQMRIGLMLAGDDAADPAYSRLFYTALADELQLALTSSDED